jgi:hypothetical protein
MDPSILSKKDEVDARRWKTAPGDDGYGGYGHFGGNF